MRPVMDISTAGKDTVPVACWLLREVIADGCCPLHLRLELERALAGNVDKGHACASADVWATASSNSKAVSTADAGKLCNREVTLFAALGGRCLAEVAAYLPLAEVLSVRACSLEQLQWAMERGASEHCFRRWVHDRIRTRLWMRRVADVTAGTKDESVFETRMRSLADEALRGRMESEMQEAVAHMEEQIHTFQAEVDRRLEEQERHVRRMVEDRVQQELDAILASEVAKVQAMVEERVQERVGTIFRREVRRTVRELQDKLDGLIEESELLRDAFAEANLRAKSLFWALHPPPMQTATLAALGMGTCALLSLKRRTALACSGHPLVAAQAAVDDLRSASPSRSAEDQMLLRYPLLRADG
mmetsp:Transcript_55249/g.119318  ORF Transcript_55249/g.119318 Transcript_55249/m.119318 type:complete len:361 (+) Transcript_55249:36-1118(+)